LLGYLGALVGPAFDLVFLVNLVLRRETAWVTMIAWLGLNGAFVFATGLALRLEGERIRSALLAPMQQFVYRQVLYLAVVRSIAAAICGIRLPWNKIRRTGNLTVHTTTMSPPVASLPTIDLTTAPVQTLVDVTDLRDWLVVVDER
jgi:hypothetical protein